MKAAAVIPLPQTETTDDMEALLPIATQIDRFLSGQSDGRALFEALYGDLADEPVPQHLLDLVRKGC